MPGPQDRVLKPTPAPDHFPPGQSDISKEGIRPAENDAPREARGEPKADLRERLKRLPPNHPSSPLPGDGSRNPFSPDRTKDALSPSEEAEPTAKRTHDTTSVPTDQADEGLDAQDKSAIDPAGSWHRRGRDLPPAWSRVGDSAVARCREAEGREADGKYGDHGLTPAMRRIETELEHGRLVDKTEQYALKSSNRFKEKLADLIKAEPDKSAEEHASEIHDGVRYTFLFEAERYTAGVQDATNRLEEHGYELGVRKNTWSHEEYKGVNTRWQDFVSGIRFEIQFHTRGSWRAKQETHEAYERINNPTITTTERERLRNYQREVSSRVIPPPGCDEISDYRKEGW